MVKAGCLNVMLGNHGNRNLPKKIKLIRGTKKALKKVEATLKCYRKGKE